MIGKTVLHEVLDINRRTIYPPPQSRPASGLPLSFEWIYRDKACTRSDVAALLAADVNEHLLVDAISKLKLDVSRLAAKPAPAAPAPGLLAQLDSDIAQLVRRSDQDRDTILANLRALDSPQRRFFNNRPSLAPQSAAPMTAAAPEKPPADSVARKNALTRLSTDRAALQQAVDALEDLDLEADAVTAACAAVRGLVDGNAGIAASQIDALVKQVAVKRDNLEFVEHNMMRDRHFILEKLCAKREEIKLLEDQCHLRLADLRLAPPKTHPPGSQLHPPPAPDSPRAPGAFAFQQPAFGVRVFEEDMSMYSHKTYAHRDDVSVHDLQKDNIRTFVKDAVRHDFKKHVLLNPRSPRQPGPLAAGLPNRAPAKGFLSPQQRRRPQAS